jgi:hypothetical protein
MNSLGALDGLFVGVLSDDELDVFEAACERGEAYRSYEGACGLVGLAKVRVVKSRPHDEEK